MRLPWWPSGKETTSQCRRQSLIPDLGDPNTCQVGQLSPSTTTTEPALESLGTATPEPMHQDC